MNRKELYQKKKELIKKFKTNILDKESVDRLKRLGFTVRFDRDGNLFIWDDINDERMYTNVMSIACMPYRVSENKYYTLEFTIVNRKIKNLSLYRKENGNKLLLKK